MVHDADQGAQLIEHDHLGLLLARVAQDLNCTFAGNVDCHLTDGRGVAVCVCVCVCVCVHVCDHEEGGYKY